MMWKRFFVEASIIAFQTVMLIGLCATIGISRSDPRAETDSGRPLGLDLYRPEPADNPPTADKVQLGQRLFRERLLSRNRSIACVDCHQPKRAFTDGQRFISVAPVEDNDEEAAPPTIRIVENWYEEFRDRDE